MVLLTVTQPRVPLRLPWAYGVRHVLTWILALRAVFNVNVRQLAVNERQCFLCGLWWTMFVNGVLRTLWVGFNDTEPEMGFYVPPFLARGRHLADEASRRGC